MRSGFKGVYLPQPHCGAHSIPQLPKGVNRFIRADFASNEKRDHGDVSAVMRSMEKPGSVAFFTIASRNYVSHYRAWRASVAKFHPEVPVFLVLVDEPFGTGEEVDDAEVLLAKDILGPAFDDMALRYDVLELNTAVKAASFRYIFEHHGVDRLVYFDPDIVLYSSVQRVLEPLERGASAVLTPHVLQPLMDGAHPDDLDLLRAGTFNLGFLGLAAGAETFAFLDWWAARLRFQCFSAITEGMFTDQRWCDLIPSLMPSFAISRHPGANVAYWNLHQRPITRSDEGEWHAGGHRLLFFHYSGFSVEDPRVVSRHQSRLGWDDLGEAQELFLAYKRELLENGWERTHSLPYAYGRLNGVPLSTPIRRLYGRRYPTGLAGEAIAALDIESLCTARDTSVPQLRGTGVSALAAQLFSMRPDIQAKFAVRTPWGRWGFHRWIKRHAAKEYKIPKQLVAK